MAKKTPSVMADIQAKAEQIRSVTAEDRQIAAIESKLSAARGETTSLRKDNERLIKRNQELSATLDQMANLVEQERIVAKPIRIDLKKEPNHHAIAIVHWSDWHVAERVYKSKTNGKNAFNPEICRARVKKLTENTLKLIELSRKHVVIDEMVFILGGDFITGFLHEELAQTNCMGVTEECYFAQMLLEESVGAVLASAGMKKTRIVCHRGNHGRCHDDQTEILTPEGWKTHLKIKTGDLVATYNVHTRQSQFQPLLGVYRSEYDGEVFKAEDTYSNFVVTPNHKMIVCQNRTEDTSLVDIQDIDFDSPHCYMPKYGYGKSNDCKDVSDEILSLIGWIMTDGGYEYKNDKPYQARLYQSKTQNLEIIRQLLNSLSMPFTESTRNRMDGRTIKGRKTKANMAEKIFTLLQSEARDELFRLLPLKTKLPEVMHRLSQRQVNVWLKAAMLGDGHEKMRSTVAFRADKTCGLSRVLYGTKAFLDQVQSLLLMNGTSATVRKDNRGDFVMHIHKGIRMWFSKKHPPKRTHYRGTVWCGTVDNGTLITRRNGVPLISGNSTRKMQFKNDFETSFETLIYWNLRDRLTMDGVEWVIPQSDIAYTTLVKGVDLRTIHGHQIKYQGGIGGVSIPLTKWIIRQNQTRPAIATMLGHFHTFCPAATSSICGSLKGWDEFAQSHGFTFEEPSQLFMLFDCKRHHLTARHPIFVE